MTYQQRSDRWQRQTGPGSGTEPGAGALVGAAVRAERLRVGLSMRELARRAGISQPFLSQVERGVNAPSVNTVYRLAEALGVSPATLVPAPSAPDIHVIRAEQREVSALNERPNTAYARIARHTGWIAEIVDYDVAPGEDIEGWFRREQDEALLVVEGRLQVDFEGRESVELGPGDCLFHPGAVRHGWRRLDDGPLRVALIVAGPSEHPEQDHD